MPLPVTGQQSAAPANLPTAKSGDDIVVRALRIPRTRLPTEVHWDHFTVVESQIAAERSHEFARCAVKLAPAKLLRAAIDGRINSPEANYAQGWIMVGFKSCGPSAPGTRLAADIGEYGRSPLNRGALIEQVLRRYAPDAALAATETDDLAVRNRFRRVQSPRNALRLETDRNALVVASCLVRSQPVLATRLFRSTSDSPLERGLIQTILVESRDCMAGVKRLTINPARFRGYLMDAFYRWLLAVRNLDSLIADEPT
jgi:hypothetical protein